MCGIFAYSGNKQNVAELTLAGLKTLEYRGYDSWGIAIKPNGKEKLAIEKHIGKIGEATTSLPSSHLGIGHTRWATHGGVTDQNAHPHTNDKGTIAVVHNGIVENHQELRIKLKEKGYVFLSETDSEVLAHLIDSFIKFEKKSFLESVLSCFHTITGSNAIVALSTVSDEIVACRNGSPLVVGISDSEIVMASDVTAVLPYTKNVHYLNDGEAVHIYGISLELYDLRDNKKIPLQTETIEWSVENAQKGGYPHYMLKEIFEQTKTISKAVAANRDNIVKVQPTLDDAHKILLTGCGTAYHCAMLGTYFFAKSGSSAQSIPANEFEPFATTLNEKSVLIAISQSGETADTLLAVKSAKANGAKVIAIINARGSTLERIADHVLPVGTGPEISVVSTKAFTAQSTVLYALTQGIGGKTNFDDIEKSFTKWINDDLTNKVFEIARKIVDSRGIFVIGKHTQFPSALENALKIKEASYIHAEGFAAGELKHGVISLIEKGVPAIVLADDETRNDVLSSATELRSRGALIIGIAPFSAPEFDIHISTPNLGDLTYLGNVVVGQLLGYALSIGRGCDPDKPRNLAKSVTVK